MGSDNSKASDQPAKGAAYEQSQPNKRALETWREIRQTLSTGIELLWAASPRSVLLVAAFNFAIVLLGGVVAASTPYFLKLLVDELTLGPPFEHMIYIYAGAFVATQAATNAFGYAREFVSGVVDQRLGRVLGDRLFAHVLSLPSSFHINRTTGAVTETVEQAIRGFQVVLRQGAGHLIPPLFDLALASLVLLALGHLRYVWLLLICGLGYIIVVARSGSKILERVQVATKAQVEAKATLTDGLQNYELIKAFTAEEHFAQRYRTNLETTEAAWGHFFRLFARHGVMATSVFLLCLTIATVLTIGDVRAGALTAGDFVLITGYVVRTVLPLESLAYGARELLRGVAYLQSAVQLFGAIPEKTEGTRQPRSPIRGEITFEDVSFSYISQQPILRGVSFTIPPGSSVAVVGESGAGKSTIARLLLRMIEPDEGSILFDGVSTKELGCKDLRRLISLVPQNTMLINGSIRDNIALGNPKASAGEIARAGAAAQLHDLIARLPDGYDTKVGDHGARLSMGERQRVAIARAFIKRAPLAIYDEPTSSLDVATELHLLPALLCVANGQTTICITHRLSLAQHSDLILVLEDGRLIESGTHSSLASSAGHYAELWKKARALQ
jgi:ATP-binding cassette subfamily B protein